MPSFRLHPLLIAGAACLTLAACGSDDDPPKAAAPTPAETAPAQAPTSTAPDSAATTDTSDAPVASPDVTPTTTESADAPDSSAKDQPARATKDDTSNDADDVGRAATETVKVRESLIALQEAFAAKDGRKACSYMIGVPQKSDAKNPGMSCESLSQGPKGTLSQQNRTIATTAKVTVNGNEAIAEVGPGAPLKLRKVDGRWRVDYSQIARPGGGSR